MVGATFFSKNIHQELISQLVANLEEEAQPPFSIQPRRIVREYLKERNLGFLTNDEELVGVSDRLLTCLANHNIASTVLVSPFI